MVSEVTPRGGVEVGLTATAVTVVDAAATARAVGSGALDVFATPMLVALLERAACACLEGRLAPGETSVGTAIAVAHTAASPVGAQVTATATVTAVQGRRVEFQVAAADETRAIGAGSHERVIVDAARFLAKVTDPGA